MSYRGAEQAPGTALDEAVLEEVFSIMPDDMEMLLSSFQQDAELRLQIMSDAIERGQADELQRTAHTLKGGALGVGAVGYAAECKVMEELGRNGDLMSAPRQLTRLQHQLCGVIAALEQWYKARRML